MIRFGLYKVIFGLITRTKLLNQRWIITLISFEKITQESIELNVLTVAKPCRRKRILVSFCHQGEQKQEFFSSFKHSGWFLNFKKIDVIENKKTVELWGSVFSYEKLQL